MTLKATAEQCEACGRARPPEVTEDWTWIWSELAKHPLYFYPTCSAKLPPPSDDNRPMS
jgi:hypothetical protein